jgi:hypothetical protein
MHADAFNCIDGLLSSPMKQVNSTVDEEQSVHPHDDWRRPGFTAAT